MEKSSRLHRVRRPSCSIRHRCHYRANDDALLGLKPLRAAAPHASRDLAVSFCDNLTLHVKAAGTDYWSSSAQSAPSTSNVRDQDLEIVNAKRRVNGRPVQEVPLKPLLAMSVKGWNAASVRGSRSAGLSHRPQVTRRPRLAPTLRRSKGPISRHSRVASSESSRPVHCLRGLRCR